MTNRRILNDVVTLYNYVGEINDEASYQETIINRCYCPLNEGADLNKQGKKASDSAKLYIFDVGSVAVTADGTERSYLSYDEWSKLIDKSAYWTLSDKGNDYYLKDGASNKLRVVAFSRKKAGSKRMWHFEVDGR